MAIMAFENMDCPLPAMFRLVLKSGVGAPPYPGAVRPRKPRTASPILPKNESGAGTLLNGLLAYENGSHWVCDGNSGPAPPFMRLMRSICSYIISASVA